MLELDLDVPERGLLLLITFVVILTPLVGQGFSFAGLHLGDPAPVQYRTADKLHVEVPHFDVSPRRLSYNRERLR